MFRHRSKPSSNQFNCSPFKLTVVVFLSVGHWKRCFCKLLYHRQNPFFSQYRILILLRCRFIKTKSVLAKGSSDNVCSTMSESPLIDFLKSTGSMHKNTLGNSFAGRIIGCVLFQEVTISSLAQAEHQTATGRVPVVYSVAQTVKQWTPLEQSSVLQVLEIVFVAAYCAIDRAWQAEYYVLVHKRPDSSPMTRLFAVDLTSIVVLE